MRAKLASPARILVLGFAAVILLGTFLLMLPVATTNNQGLSFADALFEATSAVCVTGLIVVDTGTALTSMGQVILALLVQIGGLGFMTMATLLSLLIGKRIGLRERLVMQEALNQLSIRGIVRVTIYIVSVTLVIEGIAALILTLRWWSDLGFAKALFFGVFHAITGFCNAGFDLFGGFRSLTGYVADPVVNIVICSLIALGGIGFSVIADVLHKRSIRQLSLHSKLVIFVNLLLWAGGFVLFFLLEYNNPKTLESLSLGGKLWASLFQTVTPRTAGYNTVDIAGMYAATQFLVIILMFIGASPGSTGGGIKTSTFGSLVMAVWSMIKGKRDVEIFHRRLPQEIIYRSLAIATIAGLLVVVMTMILTITENADFLTILFEVVSAFGTVGLTMGITTELTTVGKLLIALTMFIGRVGPLTLAFALARGKGSTIRQPEEKIIVG